MARERKKKKKNQDGSPITYMNNQSQDHKASEIALPDQYS
jgi:hypothetical protein